MRISPFTIFLLFNILTPHRVRNRPDNRQCNPIEQNREIQHQLFEKFVLPCEFKIGIIASSDNQINKSLKNLIFDKVFTKIATSVPPKTVKKLHLAIRKNLIFSDN